MIHKLILLLTILALFSCSPGDSSKKGTAADVPVKRDTIEIFKDILDSTNVSGSILVFDPGNGVYYSNDFVKCGIGHLPASTFKIPNSIIALETGVVEDDSTIFRWEGEKRRMVAWEQDLYFRDAFHVSCVPCYQEIARKVGVERMREYLKKINYGNMVVDSASIDLFWLEGPSEISQFEQIDFLFRFYKSQLPISERTEAIMKRLLVIEENDTFRLSGKTGWSVRNGNNNGWFVGYLEKGAEVYFVATNIDPNAEFNLDLFLVIRKEISLKALKEVERRESQ